MSRQPFTWKENTPEGVKDLWHWQMEEGTSFNCKIFELLGKADQENNCKIATTWPKLHQAWTAWHKFSNSDAFFEQYQEFLPE
jgi:hypothetical protein